jgi:uncharacterized protein YbjT (DUF2867 family)
MRILICGATGFIGSRLTRHLNAAGHTIIAGSRQPGGATAWLPIDFSCSRSVAEWQPLLSNIDLVINAIGIITESGSQTFAALQSAGPISLFTACSGLGIRVIQISGLGAERDGDLPPFLASKREADRALMDLSVDSIIVHPAVVIGEGGSSTALFCTLAALPVVPLPGNGGQKFNPIPIDDLCASICHMIEHWPGGKQRYLLTGREVFSLRELLGLIRQWRGLRPPLFLPLPQIVLTGASIVMEKIHPQGLIRRNTLSMLENVATPPHDYLPAPPAALKERLQQTPASSGFFLLRLFKLFRPALIAALAIVWIGTGLLSLGPGWADSENLLRQAGITGLTASLLITGGGGVDILLGGLRLSSRWRPLTLALQIGVMLFYMGLITVLFPHLWLSPLGEVVKNIPMLALSAFLLMQEMQKPDLK